ncbi:MAG TPA: P-loop NTPase [Desulfuromonadaceae bacterium]|jgi:nitrogenase iron protein NifH
MRQQIAFYGKGGIGKSTLISDLSAALAEAGFSVLQIGCDSKGDSCCILNNGVAITTVFDLLRSDNALTLESVVHYGFKGIACVELGDSSSTGDCSSASIAGAFAHLNRIGLFEQLPVDFILYDIPGETSCLGFYSSIHQQGINRALVVTSGDFMSLHTANTIFRILERHSETQAPVPVGGLILNGIANSFEETFIKDFAAHTNTRTLGRIPRSLMVKQCELYGKTVIEASPLSNQSYFYRRLANQIVDDAQDGASPNRPLPMQPEQLRGWARTWGDRIYELENGLVNDGAAI